MSRNKNFDKYLSLREKYSSFYYHSFHYQFQEKEIEIEFHFSIEEEFHFRPKHIIQLPEHLKWNEIDAIELDQLVFHLGMVEVVSYWKASCAPNLIVKPFKLNKEQINWWKKLYFQGLGEFFYLNTIETTELDFVQIICDSDREIELFDSRTEQERVMVPIGGGKDSVVSIEIIKTLDKQILPMVVNPRGATIESIQNAGFKLEEAILTKRTIDKQLIELNKMGFLNGHTPFSAMLAFLTLLSSRLLGVKFIALSNESSANEATVDGTNINHQYSKSFEFEKDFRDYYQKYLVKETEYFSFLRPLSELQIGKQFSGFTQHHDSFKSCNAGSKENIWCANCPKCMFTYILLSPFIEQDSLAKIFGKKMLDDKGLKPILNELRGLSETKPFECVGTVSEVELALKNAKPAYTKEVLMSGIEKSQDASAMNQALNEWNNEHFLPKEFEEILKQNLERC